MRVLYITNIPAPYKIVFFNELGKKLDLTVVFEAKGASNQGIKFNYNLETIQTFKAVFLSEGDIKEKTVNWKITKYLKEPYDKIVIGAYSYFTEMFALLWLKTRKKPYYLSTDGGMIKADENPIKKWYKTLLISGAKGYFSPSDMSDKYLEYYGAKKNAIYRYPFTSYKKSNQIEEIITDIEKEKLKTRLNIKEKYLVLGVGQFIYRKGWNLLLNAMEGISDDVALCLIGGKPTEEYKRIVEEKKLRHVYFKDFMKSEELSEYYKAADLFVLPTREDIWGLVINEAMNYGLPVITTTACVAGQELVENYKNGFILNIKNENEMTYELNKKICLIFETSGMKQRMGKESLKMIEKYSIENMAVAYEKVLQRYECYET